MKTSRCLRTASLCALASAFIPARIFPLDRGLVGVAMRERRLVHVPDVRKDPRYLMFNPETRSEMAVPLIYKGKVIGMLDIEHTRTNYFNEDHERAMTTLAAQIAISIENAQLYQRVAQQEQRLERDLAMAREVQLRLLPPFKPSTSMRNFRRASCRRAPSAATSTTLCGMTRTAAPIVLGDVSGKATAAALYAALVSGIMRSAASQLLSPSELLESLNDSLQERKRRLAVCDDALFASGTTRTDSADRQCRRRAAALLPRWRGGYGAGGRLSPGDVSQREV